MPYNYLDITELAGEQVSEEQVQRLCNRYYWAGAFCKGKDVLEAACGPGQGLGYLSMIAKSLKAGDYSEEMINNACKHYDGRIELQQFDAKDLPFVDNSFDIVILFEAIYYLPYVDQFVEECKRVLRKNGKVLIATANKDLYDFNPSPHSYRYFGIVELNELFSKQGFTVECFGDTPIGELSLKQRILRPAKLLAVKLNLMPKSKTGKKIFKRMVFGEMITMPAEIDEKMTMYNEPAKIPITMPDTSHKVIYCIATLQ